MLQDTVITNCVAPTPIHEGQNANNRNGRPGLRRNPRLPLRASAGLSPASPSSAITMTLCHPGQKHLDCYMFTCTVKIALGVVFCQKLFRSCPGFDPSFRTTMTTMIRLTYLKGMTTIHLNLLFLYVNFEPRTLLEKTPCSSKIV